MSRRVSAPAIAVEEVILNQDNPFKKTITWMRLRCRLCGEIVLGKGISNYREWNKVRMHLLLRHGIDEGGEKDVPVRLLSPPLLRRWVREQLQKSGT